MYRLRPLVCALPTALLLMLSLPAAAGDEPAVDSSASGGQTADTAAREEPAAADEQPAKKKKTDEGVTTSLTQTLQGESGVAIQTMCTNCNSADLSMGGLDNAHISMVCDGVPVPPGLAQIYLLSVCPPTVIDNVAVEKGASSASFDASAVGGEIAIRRRKPSPGLDLAVSGDTGSFGWAGTRADLSGRAGWFGGGLAASWATSDQIDADSDGNPDDAAYDRMTVEVRTDMKLGRRQRLRLGGEIYREDQTGGRAAYFVNTFSSGSGWNLENVNLDRDQADAVYEVRFPDGSRVSVTGLWAKRSNDIQESFREFAPAIPEDQMIPTYFIDETHRHSSLTWSRPMGTRVLLRSGFAWTEREFSVVDVRYNAFVLGLPLDGDALTRADREAVTEQGGWVEGEFDLGNQLSLQVGARWVDFEYDEQAQYPNEFVRGLWEAYPLPEGNRTLPRAALTWKPAAPVTLRLSAGTGFHQPNPTYEEVCCGRRYRGNRGIRMERSRAVGLEATYQPSPRLRVAGSVFRTDFRDMVVHMVTSVEPFYAPTYQNANIPKARITSYDVDGRYGVNRWLDVKGSLHYCDGQNRSPGDRFDVLVSDFNQPTIATFETPDLPYIPEKSGGFGLAVHTPDSRWIANVDAIYTGDQVIQRFLETPSVTYDLAFAPTESFWVVNLRLSHTFPKGIAAYVGVDNLNDYIQTDLADPSTDYTWAPLRGRYVYGGLSYRFAARPR